MKIVAVSSRCQGVPLTRPYTIAFATRYDVDLLFVRLVTEDGRVGLGSGSPAPDITGETVEAATAALAPERLDWLRDADVRTAAALCRRAAETMAATPAARAAVDMALWDLFAQALELPLVQVLGQCHSRLPTSITIGIKSTEEALEECDEYLGRGFRSLKIKIGNDLDADVERLEALRARAGTDIAIRVDGNQGYDTDSAVAFFERTRHLDLELIEQPLPADAVDAMRTLPADLRAVIAADESAHHEADIVRLLRPETACGIVNIKLMKCGGPTAALRMATMTESAGVDLMWGCMDESVISIAAALHTAYACPHTRYLDLDGSFDLARDLAVGGFVLDQGCLLLPDAPGLGVRLADDADWP